MAIRFDKDKAENFLNTSLQKAEEFIRDEDKLESLLEQLEKKLKTVPVAGGALSYIPALISLVRSFVKREYRKVPVATLLAIVATLLYWLAPMDVLMDIIPGIGFVDDAAVIAGALSMVKKDLNEYMMWRRSRGLSAEELPDVTEVDGKTLGKFSLLRSMFRKKLLQKEITEDSMKTFQPMFFTSIRTTAKSSS